MFFGTKKTVNLLTIVYDPGYKNTAVRKSRTTHIDGNKGELSYLGHSISHLFQNHDYEEVAHLLIWKQFPTAAQKQQFRKNVAREMVPSDSVVRIIQDFDPSTEAYLMIAAGLCAWAASKPECIPVHAGDGLYLGNSEATDAAIYRSIAALMTVTAIVSCCKEKTPFVADVDPTVSPIDNMLRMMKRVDAHGNVDQKTSTTVNKLCILFADHEMTNSTAAFLHAASSLSDPISSSASAILASQGPLHAGAIDLAFRRFAQIRDARGGVKKHLEDAKAGRCRVMGVGHRVYRTVDPRITHLKQLLEQFAVEIAGNPLLEVAMEIEHAVQADEYFTSRNLGINVDLYGSFVYAALGLHSSIFTPMAIIARSAGIYSYWRESMHEVPCLWRPRQVYTGHGSVAK
ncbi:citrate synthase [Stemphylium lycopersici]|uniref:Citrate synthase n=1 Tax=Stemphylium lycopersici TaxID=183478 RepID=A0A364NF43_STELY|nr:citrate synthase [Stemphylium lycopersici]RAR10977.1 citrate synthase [Stemphylium lycopersici]RAR15721.1 citrate synthase [Stemphylium lycopersici]